MSLVTGCIQALFIEEYLKNITCTPFSQCGTLFLMRHGVQGSEHFITLTQTLHFEKKMIGTPFFRGTL